MFFLGVYYNHAEFNSRCKPGLSSSRNGILNTAYSSIGSTYTEEEWVGSFCPKNNDTKNLALKAYPKLRSWMNGLNNYDNSGGAIRCSGGDAGSNVDVSFPSNRCFSFKMTLYTSCSYSGRMYMDRKTPSGDWTRATNEQLITCQYDDCLPGFWGPNCQYGPVNYDYNQECFVSLGISGTGKCTCGSASSIQEHCRPGTSPGFDHTIYSNSNGNDNSKVVSNIIPSFEELKSSLSRNQDPYLMHVIKGKLYISKTGTYSFRAEGNTLARIKVHTAQTTSISNYFECSTQIKTASITAINLETDQLYDFQIEYYSGCSIVDSSLSFEWKLPETSEFTTIPTKYLFHKN